MPNLLDSQLVYSAYARCPCGAGLAHKVNPDPLTDEWSWDCSAILKGEAIKAGEPDSVEHTSRLPFMFYEIKSENQLSAKGATTRKCL